MFNSEIKEKIKILRYLKQVIEPRPEWLKGNRDILMMQIKNNHPLLTLAPEGKMQFTWVWSFLGVFMPRGVVSYAIRPLVVICLAFGMVFGGWVTTVSASYNSLPGDVLYSVKLATENVQTSLANKPDAAKLHTQFAVRRVEEVKTIVKSNLPKKEKKVEEAVNNLKNELDQVKGTLEDFKKPATADISASQVVAVAKAVNDQTTAIQKTLEQTATQLVADTQTSSTASLTEQVKQASAAAVDAGVKAVEVIVQKHQEDNNVVPAVDVKNAVDGKIKVLEDKVTKVEEKINTIVATTSTLSAMNISERKEEKDRVTALVNPVKEDAATAKEVIKQAKTELANDNFGGALDKLKQGSALTQVVEVKTEATQILAMPLVVASSTLGISASSSLVLPPENKIVTSTIIAPSAVSATSTTPAPKQP